MKKTSDNGYFITSPNHEMVSVEKAHFCTWNLPSGLEFLEVGLLVKLENSFLMDFERLKGTTRLVFNTYIPWYEEGCSFGDLFPVLKDEENARFVFNDQVQRTSFVSDGGRMPQGVLFEFQEGDPFCLLPVVISPCYGIDKMVSAEVSFPKKMDDFKKVQNRIYIRFYVKSKTQSIPWKHGGIAKTSFCYDIKVNEPRNAPNGFPLNETTPIQACYCLHIVPASFECSLQDHTAFKSIRTLEAAESAVYTSGIPEIAAKITPGDCLVVFNKLKHEDNPKLPFSFFTIFTRERIGPSQLALAIGANIGCGLLASWTWIASLIFLALVILVAVGISLWNRFGARIRSALGLI